MRYTPEQKAAWDRVMQILKENLDNLSFNAWFKGLSLYAVKEDRIIIVGQNAFNLQHMQLRRPVLRRGSLPHGAVCRRIQRLCSRR